MAVADDMVSSLSPLFHDVGFEALARVLNWIIESLHSTTHSTPADLGGLH